ncbi:peptidoglycan-binding protein [Brachybacterium sp. DNPG3]
MALATASMPKAWSNKDKVERLRTDAFESLTRMLPRAVADTGTNFQIWSALRTHAEQVALFVANYVDTHGTKKTASTDRWYGGTVWKRRAGGVAVASPDLGSNHQSGVAIDIHPAAIQDWIKTKGGAHGWDWAEGRRAGEDWHFRYFPERDRYRAEGLLDHAAVQRVVGADVDGKIGTGTVALIRAWQGEHGLTVDGKVGPVTKAAMGLAGKDEPTAAAPDLPSALPAVAADLIIETPGDSPNANHERYGQEVATVTFHWWGEPSGQTHDGTVAYLLKDRGNAGTSAHYVASPGRVSRCVPEDWTAWSSGSRTVNRGDISIECDPNDPVGTLPTAAALLADIWTRHPDAVVHIHSDWVPTTCNGTYEDLMTELLALASGAVVDLPVTVPDPTLPTGKALLVKLKDLPDFPLLRTPEHRCYYGPQDGPAEAVSGKSPNSLNPGEVTGSGLTSSAQGLARYQQKRGLTADGRYGPATEADVRALQRKAGLTVDGKLGPTTWYATWLVA